MAAPTIVVNNSTSVVFVDTSVLTAGQYALVLMSSVKYSGTLVTIRDFTGNAASNKPIVVSTTAGSQFLDGRFSTLINQPFGFLTFNSYNSDPPTWQMLNSFAFSNTNEAAYVKNLNAETIVLGTTTSAQVNVSTLSATNIFVGPLLSSGNSTILAEVFAYSNVTVKGILSTASQLNASTLTVANVAHLSNVIVTQGDLTKYALRVSGPTHAIGRTSISSALDVVGTTRISGITILDSTLMVYQGAYFFDNLSSYKSLAIGDSLYVSAVQTAITFNNYVRTNSTLHARSNAVFYANTKILADLQVSGSTTVSSILQVGDTAYFQGSVSTTSDTYIGRDLRVASTFFSPYNAHICTITAVDVLSTLFTRSSATISTNLIVQGNLFTFGNTFFNSLDVYSSIISRSSMNVSTNLTVQGNIFNFGTANLTFVDILSTLFTRSSAIISTTLIVLGNAAFNSNVCTIGTLTQMGDVFMFSTLNTQQNINVLSNISIGSNLTVGNSLFVQGSTLLSGAGLFTSHTSTSGIATFLSSVNMRHSLNIQNSLNVVNHTVLSTFSTYGTGVVDKDLIVNGTLYVNRVNPVAANMVFNKAVIVQDSGTGPWPVNTNGWYMANYASTYYIGYSTISVPQVTVFFNSTFLQGYMGINNSTPTAALDINATDTAGIICRTAARSSFFFVRTDSASNCGAIEHQGTFGAYLDMGRIADDYNLRLWADSTISYLEYAAPGYSFINYISLASSIGIGTKTPNAPITLASTTSVLGNLFVNNCGSRNNFTAAGSIDQHTLITHYISSSGAGDGFIPDNRAFKHGYTSVSGQGWTAGTYQLYSYSNIAAPTYSQNASLVWQIDYPGNVVFDKNVTVNQTLTASNSYISTLLITRVQVSSGVMLTAENLPMSTNSSFQNGIRFFGTQNDGPNQGFGQFGPYFTTAIMERCYDYNNEKSELLLFKGNDGNDYPTSGPDRVRVLAGQFQVDTYTGAGAYWPINGTPPTGTVDGQYAVSTALVINQNNAVVHGNLTVTGTFTSANANVSGDIKFPVTNI